MSHLSPTLARRLDRLARRAHAFHRFAHHPLCAAYAGEVFRLGRLRICRGCTLSALGAVGGGLAGWGIPHYWPLGLVLALGGAVAHGVGLRRRVLTRFGAGVGLAACAVAGLRLGGWAWLLPLGSVMGLLLGLSHYRQRGPQRALCEGCAERASMPMCAGTALQRRRERAFQRLAGRWIADER